MSFTESIKVCFQKFIDFNGRASRSEYWWFFLFTLIVRILTGWIPFIGFIVTLVLLLPSLAVTVRRLHDTNRTGWWLLLPIVLTVVGLIVGVSLIFTDLLILGIALSVLGSVVGFVALLVFLIQPGDPHPNQYGPDPLQQRAGDSGIRAEGHPYASWPSAGGYGAQGSESEPAQSVQHGEAEQRRYCTQCGSQLQPEARFCTECGTVV